jgi:hypothetical protein
VPILAGVEPGNVTEGRAVAAGPTGIVIAGNICCRQEGTAVWFSPDGASWERADFPRLANTYLSAVAAGEDGFVAIGTTGGVGTIWTSADGVAWAQVEPDVAGLVRGELSHVVALGDGFLVAGMDDARGLDSNAALWASTGLGDWRRAAAADPALAGPDEASLGRLVRFAAGLFATGGTGTQEERLGCERLLRGGALLTAGPATALSCGWLREMTWRSPDGGAWERIDPWGPDGTYPPELVGPAPGHAQVAWQHILAGGPGLVGVQEELVGEAGGEGSIGTWVSADGAHWARIGDGPPHERAVVAGVVAVDRGLFALDETGAAWVGTARR